MELAVLVALWLSLRWIRVGLFRAFVILVYLLALVYALYEAIVLAIWLIDPVFYSQWYLARDGLPFLLSHLRTGWWIYAGGALVIASVVALIVVLFRVLFASGAQSRLHWSWRVIMVGIALFGVYTTVLYQVNAGKPEMVMSSTSMKVLRNVAASQQLYTDVNSFDDTAARAIYDYNTLTLARKPDIYLIVVESYGSVLYKRDDWLAEYTTLLDELRAELDEAGWHSTSALSESPTWGGGSWLAYTSILMGLRIDNQPQYISLLNRYQAEPYPNLGRMLKEQGYRFAWLSSMEDSYTETEWVRLKRFYGADLLVHNANLDYTGAGYGWGNSPPDQYALNHTIEELRAERESAGNDQPLFLMTITQNSHYPFAPQPPLLDDWQMLNETAPLEGDAVEKVDADSANPDTSQPVHDERRQNYMRAIEYQLRVLVDLVQTQGDDNSLFILVGDHQPPTVSRRNDGWTTPIHVIARDETLVNAFAEFGFTDGLRVRGDDAAIRHEGIYSMITRVLAEQSGVAQADLPEWLPEGAASTYAVAH